MMSKSNKINQKINTVADAAAVIIEIYKTIEPKAVDFTDSYRKERLRGKKGVTWDTVEDFFGESAVPIFDSVLRETKDITLIKLGAYQSRGHGIRYEFSFQELKNGVLNLYRQGRGYDPGSNYVIADNTVGKAASETKGPAPTICDGHFAWSVPRTYLTKTYVPLTELDGDLMEECIKKLKKYI